MEKNMTRREIIEELLERLECELDELNNTQLMSLVSEYEHAQILGVVIEGLSIDADIEEEEDDEEDKDDEEELPLIDGDWDETEE